MIWFGLGFGLAVFMFWLGHKLSDPSYCPVCGSPVVRWDYDRIVCSNTECNWED